MSETIDKEEAKEVATFIVAPFAFCTCCVSIFLLGTAISFATMVCAEGKRSSGCSLVVLPPSDVNSSNVLKGGGGYHRHRMIEESTDRWGFDFGGANLGSVSASASVSVAQNGYAGKSSNSNSGTGSSGASEVPPKDVLVYSGDLEKIENHWAKFITVAIGYIFCKLLKLAGIYSKFFPGKNPYPVHLTTIFLSEKQIKGFTGDNLCLEGLVNVITFIFDYILLSWAPNMATIPFTSIAGEDKYINTIQIKYDTDMFWSSAVGLGGGMVAYLVIFTFDSFNAEKDDHKCPQNWPAWKDSGKLTKFLRTVAVLARTYLLAISVGSLYVAYLLSRVQFSLLFGLNFGLLFRWSFRFGLMIWATLLRLVLTAFTFIDFVVSFIAFFLSHMVEKEDETRREKRRVSTRTKKTESAA